MTPPPNTPLPAENAGLLKAGDVETAKAVYGLDPTTTGNRNRGWRYVDAAESEEIAAYSHQTVLEGSLAVHTRDGGSNPLCADSCRAPNFIASIQDDYDCTYRDYFYAPLDRPALSPPAEGSGWLGSDYMAPTPAPVDWSVVGPKLVEEREALRDMLVLILPLAKGYAAANRVGSNAVYIQAADDLLANGE